MFESRPEQIATKMGLDFTFDATRDGKYRRFFFKQPDPGAVKGADSITLGGAAGAATLKAIQDYEATPQAKSFAEFSQRLGKWLKRVKPWTFDPQPPGETGIIVAAELSFGNRFRVAAVNKKNREKLAKFWSPEAQVRRAALSQTTPEAALNVLKEQLAKYQIAQPDAETLALKAAFEKSAAIVALDGIERPQGVTYQ